VVRFFHQPDDPYSALAAAVLPEMAARYRVRIEPHAVPPPARAAAPDRARLGDWSQRDARRLAARLGIAPLAAPPTGLATEAAALQQLLQQQNPDMAKQRVLHTPLLQALMRGLRLPLLERVAEVPWLLEPGGPRSVRA
jgi:2-hydroxychromene-2-carboxylate isomerase